jgi:hypothetical protein
MVNIVLAINTDDFFLMIRTFPRGFMDQGGIRLSLIMTPYASRRKIKYNGRKQERGRFYGAAKMDC